MTILCSPFAAVVVSLRVWVTITRESRVAVASGSVAVTAGQLIVYSESAMYVLCSSPSPVAVTTTVPTCCCVSGSPWAFDWVT